MYDTSVVNNRCQIRCRRHRRASSVCVTFYWLWSVHRDTRRKRVVRVRTQNAFGRFSWIHVESKAKLFLLVLPLSSSLRPFHRGLSTPENPLRGMHSIDFRRLRLSMQYRIECTPNWPLAGRCAIRTHARCWIRHATMQNTYACCACIPKTRVYITIY